MKYSVFTASTPEWSPTEAAQTLASQGWDGIEWRVTNQTEAPIPGFWVGNRATWALDGLEESVAQIADITRSAGLAFSGIGGYTLSSDRSGVERMLAATAKLGANQVRITVPRVDSGNYSTLFALARKDWEWVAETAANYGVRALVELHHETLTASASAARRLVEGFDPVHVGVIHDVGNLVIEGYEEYAAGFEILGEYLAHVHIKNARWVAVAQGNDDLLWSHEWAPLRTGQANIAAYVDALVGHGYDGWITLEDFSTEQPLAQRTRANLAYVQTLVDAAQSRQR